MATDVFDEVMASLEAPKPRGDVFDEVMSSITPPGTVRRGAAGELGAALVRGALNLGNVPYNAGAALTGGVAAIYAPRAERTQMEQLQAPQSDREVLAGRIDTQIRDLQNQLGVLAQPPQTLGSMVNDPQGMQRFMATRALTPDQTRAQRASILQKIADLENQKRQYTTLSPPEALSVGFAQQGQSVQAGIDSMVPPTAQAVTGERPWYSPLNIASVTLENAPQIVAQLVLTRGLGGLGVGGTAAARFAASGVPIQLSQAMETQNNARLQPGQSPTAQADAVQAGAPYAVLDASLNAVIERLTAKGLIGTDEASQAAARMTLRQRAVGALKAAPLAGATGAFQETGQEFTSAAIEAGSVNPDAMNADKLLPRLALAGITGGLLEGPMGAASQFTSTGLGSGSNNANASGRDPVPNAPARFDPRVAQEAFTGTPEVQGPVVDSRTTPATAGTIDPADAAQTAGDVPQGAKGSPGATEDGGPGIDLAAVEAAGRQDAADNLEPEALPDGTDPAVVQAYMKGYTNGQTTTAQTAEIEDASPLQLAATDRGSAGPDTGGVPPSGVFGDGQGVPDRRRAGAGPVGGDASGAGPRAGAGVGDRAGNYSEIPNSSIPAGNSPEKPDSSVPAAAKQPWEMTRAEYNATLTPQALGTFGEFQHKNFVREAMASGERVPQRVINDYPGIAVEAEAARANADRADPLTARNQQLQDAREQSRKSKPDRAYQAKVDENIEIERRRQDFRENEAWKVSRSQYVTYKRGGAKALQEAEHREAVSNAIAAGKPVPPAVLADYPDLAQNAPPPLAQNAGTATPNPVPGLENADSELSRRGGATGEAPVRTPEQQRRLDELKAGVERIRGAKGSTLADIADRLEAQAAELTRGGGPAGINPRTRGATNLPAEIVALAYRAAAQALRFGDRSIKSIKEALDKVISSEGVPTWMGGTGGEYTDAQRRAALREALRVVRAAEAEQPLTKGAKRGEFTKQKLRRAMRNVQDADYTMADYINGVMANDEGRGDEIARGFNAGREDFEYEVGPDAAKEYYDSFKKPVKEGTRKALKNSQDPVNQVRAWILDQGAPNRRVVSVDAASIRPGDIFTVADSIATARQEGGYTVVDINNGPQGVNLAAFERFPMDRAQPATTKLTNPPPSLKVARRRNVAEVARQKNERQTVAKMLEATIRGREQGRQQGFKAGVQEGKAQATNPQPTTVKQQVAKTTGMVDGGDAKTVSERDALAAKMKAQEQASAQGYREGIRRVSEAVALARADEKAKGLGVIERYDKARKSIRKAIEDNLPASERGRFLAMLDNAKTPLQVARGMRRVAAAAVSLDARALMKSVDSMAGVMELRKLSAQRRAEADDLIAQAEALRPAVGRPDAEDPSKMQAMAAAAKTLKGIDHELAFLYADQKAADKTFAADKRRTAAEHAKVFIDNVSAVREANPGGSGNAGPRVAAFASIFNFNDFVGLASSLEGKDQTESVLAAKWNDMRQRDLDRADQALELRQKLDEAAKVGGYSSLTVALEKASGQLGVASAETHLVKLGGKDVRLTVDELMQVYLDLKDSSTRALFAGGMPVVQSENAGGSKIKATLDELEAAVGKLTPAQMKAADAVGKVVRSIGPEISEVHKALTGRGIELSADYNPRRRSSETADAPKDPPSGWAGVRGAMLENSPFTQEREGGTERARVLGGLFRDSMDYIDNATRMIHLAEPVRELYAITGSGAVREALADRYGEVVNKRLDQFIMAAAGTTRTTVTGAGEAVAAANSLMASANLVLRPTTLAMNSASVIRLAPVMDARTYADGLAGAKDVSAADINAVGYFSERFNTDPGARASGIGEAGNVSAQSRASVRRAMVASVRSLTRGNARDSWRAYRRAMGSIPLMNMAEMIPAKVAYAGYLAESKRTSPKRTDAEHRKYAGQKAAMAFRQIQNASSAMDQSTAQLTVKGQGSAGLLLFGSDTIRTYQRLRQAKRDGNLRNFLTAEALNIATGTAIKKGFRAALVLAGASMAGNDDEWERFQKQDLALEAWARAYLRDAFGATVPFAGGYVVPAFERVEATVRGKPQPRTFREFEPALMGVLTDLGDFWNDFARGREAQAKGDDERAAKAFGDALASGTALGMTALGVPLKPAADYWATMRRAGSATIDRAKESNLAADAIRDGNEEDAGFYIARLVSDGDKPVYDKRRAVVNLLNNKGPRGNLSDKQWAEKVNAEPDPAKRREMREEQRKWEAAVREAVRKSAPNPSRQERANSVRSGD